MSEFTERVGVAEIFLDDVVVATGTYNLVIERGRGYGASTEENRARARGTIRLQDGHTAHKAMTAPSVRMRLDGEVDLKVEVHLYVPGASFVAFTCSEAAGLDRLQSRDRPD